MDSTIPESLTVAAIQQQQQQQIPQQLPAFEAAQSQAQPPAGATPSSTGRTRLSFDEIARFFNLPIAEAASNLGVCTSVLKRLCRENGIIRWPYRKFLAGKSVEEIRKEAEIEKAKERAESKAIKQQANISKSISITNESKAQQDNSLLGQTMQQGSKSPNSVPLSMLQPSTVKHIHTYMDEFVFGFPSNGLSRTTYKWWGDSSTDRVLKLESKTNRERKEASSELSDESSMLDDDYDDDDGESNTEDSCTVTLPSALLCSIRRKVVGYGSEALKAGTIKDKRSYKLSKRQRSVLVCVFKSTLPDQCKKNFL